jgi:hypothetical protein
MSRKGLVLAATVALVLGGTGSLLYLLLHHEADWYAQCDLPPPAERAKASGRFVSKFDELLIAKKRPFNLLFTAKEINSFFSVGFVDMNLARNLPDSVREPRIAIEPNKIRLAFRYGSGWLNTVVSVDVGVWLAHQNGKDHSTIAVELQSMHAGSIPISAQALLEQVSEAARQQNIDVVWYRHNGNPVALLRFQADRLHPTVQLDQLELRQGMIVLRGRSSDANGLQAMLPMLRGLPELAQRAD